MKLSILFLLSIVLLLICSVPYASAITNLLPDGSFESGQWSLKNWGSGKCRTEFDGNARSGDKAVMLKDLSNEEGSINLLAASPIINIGVEREYTLTVWFRTADNAKPLLSVISYEKNTSQNITQEEIKNYKTRGLPKSISWEPHIWRFRVKPDVGRIMIAVRNGGPGTVWFDDIALFNTHEISLNVKEKGAVTNKWGKRRLKVDILSPNASEPWKLHLKKKNSSKPVESVNGIGSETSIVLNYSEPEDTSMLLVAEDDDSGAILAKEKIKVPPVVEFEIITPRYRKTIYKSQKKKRVLAKLTCNMDSKLMKKASFSVQEDTSVSLNNVDHSSGNCFASMSQNHSQEAQLGENKESSWHAMKEVNNLWFSVEELKPGTKSIEITVFIKGIPNIKKCTAKLKVVPPADSGSEVIIGDQNETLVDGKPIFVTGFYGAPEGTSSDPISKAGYTAALTYHSDPQRCIKWLNDCKRLGIGGIVSVPLPFVKSFDEGRLRDAIRQVKNHKALLAYYLYDEPQNREEHETPENLKRVYEIVADEDPYHPISMCINKPELYDLYSDSCDVIMTNPYPISHERRPLTQVAEWIDAARASVNDLKPVWVVPQAFGGDVIENLPTNPIFLTPTAKQERAMTYLSLTHGAMGVMYYCYHVYTGYDDKKAQEGAFPYIIGGFLPDAQPQLWNTLNELGSEMKLVNPSQHGPNAIEGVVGTVHWRVTQKNKNGYAWLIAVNADEKETSTAILPIMKAKSIKYKLGDGELGEKDDEIRMTIPPMGTMSVLFSN